VVEMGTVLNPAASDELINGVVKNKELSGLSGSENSSDESYYDTATTADKDYPF
jgi:hypothetical protein